MENLKQKVEYSVSDCTCENSNGFSDYYTALNDRWYNTHWKFNLSDEDIKIMIDSNALDHMKEEKTKENIDTYIKGFMNFSSSSLFRFLTEYCIAHNESSICPKCNGNAGISKYLNYDDVKEAILAFKKEWSMTTFETSINRCLDKHFGKWED